MKNLETMTIQEQKEWSEKMANELCWEVAHYHGFSQQQAQNCCEKKLDCRNCPFELPEKEDYYGQD